MPLSTVPPKALKRSASGTPGRVSRKGVKLWHDWLAFISTMLLALVPLAS